MSQHMKSIEEMDISFAITVINQLINIGVVFTVDNGKLIAEY